MDFETFKRAVNSLKGYDGVIGVMGGEPTLHPQFERFAGYLNETYKEWQEEGSAPSAAVGADRINRLNYPQKEFIKEIHRSEFDTHHIRKHSDGRDNFMMSGPGLWSNMGGYLSQVLRADPGYVSCAVFKRPYQCVFPSAGTVQP